MILSARVSLPEGSSRAAAEAAGVPGEAVTAEAEATISAAAVQAMEAEATDIKTQKSTHMTV